MTYIVYAIRTSTPEKTDVVYCGRSLSSAMHYQAQGEFALYALLPWSYFNCK